MASTALVWIRRDLRVHDHVPLTRALAEHDRVVPVFVLDPGLVHGRFPSPGRTWFLLESLKELAGALRDRGGDLVVRTGRPHEELPRLATEIGARAVYLASDVSPYARARDARARSALEHASVEVVFTPGNFVADVNRPRTKDGRPFVVFSPFHRVWRTLERRDVHPAPDAVPFPDRVRAGALPTLAELDMELDLPEPLPAGETAARARADEFLADEIAAYADRHNHLAGGSSVLSPSLHFGCLSARELEARVARHAGHGRDAFRRQLAWRDFYAHVLLHFPENARVPFQDRFAELETEEADGHFAAWCEGRTGYPLVDAAMRQLRTMGWMHNRARLVVGSFLTKDLHVDYRRGEAHFMRYLLCGDEAQNNGNWQWIAGTGVDPQPYFRRLYNPTLHQERFDPQGEYVRRWVPELRDVPLEALAEPWKMSPAEQEAVGCVLGRDYPERIVDHAEERKKAMELYRAVTG